MHYTIYKISNKIDGKVYIGSHKTKNLDDDYMGSGKYLKRAQEKYGIENFTKEILFVYDNLEEMYAKEKEIVNEDFLAMENTYNLKVGGYGGFDYINDNPDKFLTEKRLNSLIDISTTQHWNEKFKNDEKFKHKVILNAKNNLTKIKILYPKSPFYGKTHSEDTKQKMREAANERVGSKNSQYGTMWVTDGVISKKIKKTENIPDGWKSGRVIKI